MAYKTANTTATVQIVALRHLDLNAHALCDILRREAGRCWSDLVKAHATARSQGIWLSETDLNAQTKGGVYALHSQSVQFLTQQLLANVATARQNRAAGDTQANPDGGLERPVHSDRGRTAHPAERAKAE
jgi:hypothetical protein